MKPAPLSPADQSAIIAARATIREARAAFVTYRQELRAKLTTEQWWDEDERLRKGSDPHYIALHKASQKAYDPYGELLIRLNTAHPWINYLTGLTDEDTDERVSEVIAREWRDGCAEYLREQMKHRTEALRLRFDANPAKRDPLSLRPEPRHILACLSRGMFHITRITHKGKWVMATPYSGGDEVRLKAYGNDTRQWRSISQALAKDLAEYRADWDAQLKELVASL